MSTQQKADEKMLANEKPVWRRPTVTRVDMQLTASTSGGAGFNTPHGSLLVKIQ